MLAIARALMSEPKVLLVDEASLGLSPIMTETVFDLLADVNRASAVAVLVVEQNVLALDFAHRAYVLEKGEVVDVAEGAAVRTMQGRLRDAYLGRAAR
jgi:branched-chain amino acid transport system ATP-binding protein